MGYGERARLQREEWGLGAVQVQVEEGMGTKGGMGGWEELGGGAGEEREGGSGVERGQTVGWEEGESLSFDKAVFA